MIHCYPRNLFSRQYDAVAVPGGALGEVNFRAMTEQGSIVWDNVEWQVTKHGPASGYWTLSRGKEYAADAQKDSAMKRHVRVETKDLELELRPRSVFTSTFEVFDGQLRVGVIKRANVFSRRSYLEFDAEVPELIQLFCFWMVRMLWRRSQNG
ncbi:MAG: hypothetical protein HKN29_09575 [Rhodothermales bacterium]|nr:hypothetical protein [Rhodothermales bacterium]